MNEIKLVIPEDIESRYAGSLAELRAGSGTLVGYQQQLKQLRVALNDPDTPSAMLLGEQGIGKTALVEQLIYQSLDTEKPLVVTTLAIETLGQLEERVMVARMRTLLADMAKVRQATQNAYPDRKFTLALFIDEVHKLHAYGLSGDSSGAMNALKEGIARGEFPIITATTDYEYRKNIVSDPAFDRRFHKVIMQQPNRADTIKILERRLASYQSRGVVIPEMADNFLTELTTLTDAYVRNQVNPAKSLAILSSAIAYADMEKQPLNHDTLAFVFASEGYNIDSLATAKHVRDVVSRRVKGQPLALKYLSDAINVSFYTDRNQKRPLMTVFEAGTTGTGKSETAKALAEALFGREDALLVVNGGDYPTESDAKKAQSFIGDSVAVNKQQVILLDEIEKSHPTVLMAYMRMIDEGIVRDSLDIERSINNTVVIATSNLGHKIFEELKDSMKLDAEPDPNKLSQRLVNEWESKSSSVRKALQDGDIGKNNGIRPEFLERFSLFIPFLPLTKLTYATIARITLKSFQAGMRRRGFIISIPDPENEAEWQELYGGNENIHYDKLDGISVMIAEDIISSESGTIGARAIGRYFETAIKPEVARAIAMVEENGQNPNDFVYRIRTNGHASFESTDKQHAGVRVEAISQSRIKASQLASINQARNHVN